MNDNERLDSMIQELAKEYHRPPDPPRAEMWARIEAERASTRGRPARASRRVHWGIWVAGLAATLVIGVAIGRFTAGSVASDRTNAASMELSD